LAELNSARELAASAKELWYRVAENFQANKRTALRADNPLSNINDSLSFTAHRLRSRLFTLN